MAQPDFFDVLPRMSSTKKMYVGGRTSLRISSAEARVHYRLSKPIAVGYSNGANMATTLHLLRPETLAGAILLRAAQITLSDFQPPDLSRKPVLLLSGADDPTILPERFTRLVASLRRYGASLETKVVPVGHELSAADIRFGRQWIESNCFAC